MNNNNFVKLDIASEFANTPEAQRLMSKFASCENCDAPTLRLDENGLTLVSKGQELRGDLGRMMARVGNGKLAHEMLVKAAKLKDMPQKPLAIDATAGLGDDSFILAAAGYEVFMYEKNPIVFELLFDAVKRAKNDPETASVAMRMHPKFSDSTENMAKAEFVPDVILLDPMFPERQKSALVKKKLQVIQRLEIPCGDEEKLFISAVKAAPKRLIIKRPPKGPFLAGIKPDFSYTGKAVRFDCFAAPFDRLNKFQDMIKE